MKTEKKTIQITLKTCLEMVLFPVPVLHTSTQHNTSSCYYAYAFVLFVFCLLWHKRSNVRYGMLLCCLFGFWDNALFSSLRFHYQYPLKGLGATYAVHLRLIRKLSGIPISHNSTFFARCFRFATIHTFDGETSVLSQCTRLTDGQTEKRTADRRTDSFLVTVLSYIQCSAVKKVEADDRRQLGTYNTLLAYNELRKWKQISCYSK